MNLEGNSPIPEPARPMFEDCTVTAVDPLEIQRDCDESPIPFTPDTMIAPELLAVDDRVRVEIADERLIVVGREGGFAVATEADLNKLVLRDGSGRAQIVAPSVDADIANKGYVDGLTGLPYFIGTMSKANAASATLVALDVATEVADDWGMSTGSGTDITIPTGGDGLWSIKINVGFQGAANANRREVRVNINGSEVDRVATAMVASAAVVSWLPLIPPDMILAADDVVTFDIYQSSTVALDITAHVSLTQMRSI